MLEIVPTKSFKKDLKKYQYRKDVIKDLYDVISVLEGVYKVRSADLCAKIA